MENKIKTREDLWKALYEKNPTAKSAFDYIWTKEELQALLPWKTLYFTKSSTASKAKIESITSCVLERRSNRQPTLTQKLKGEDSPGMTEEDWVLVREGKAPYEF